MMATHALYRKWASIDKFSTMLNNIPKSSLATGFLQRHDGVVKYRGKLKLHGANAAVCFEAGGGSLRTTIPVYQLMSLSIVGGKLAAQSRNYILKPGGLHEFYDWVFENEGYWRDLQRRCSLLPDLWDSAEGKQEETQIDAHINSEGEGRIVRIYGEWCGPKITAKVGVGDLYRNNTILKWFG